ncbi:hypothetical protein NPIL_541361 [Nephila pilipes]|uniref:Uncharacterized protein n=1 Tax=Nephila pilipes TaxID=299642 RepID=A0A8X6UI30_NEPPI|nr:hypothetical protein NPIL_541361 [Nephila pilipes]
MALKVAMAAETPSADMMSKVLFFLPFNGERYLAGKRHRSDNTENAGIVARSRTVSGHWPSPSSALQCPPRSELADRNTPRFTIPYAERTLRSSTMTFHDRSFGDRVDVFATGPETADNCTEKSARSFMKANAADPEESRPVTLRRARPDKAIKPNFAPMKRAGTYNVKTQNHISSSFIRDEPARTACSKPAKSFSVYIVFVQRMLMVGR